MTRALCLLVAFGSECGAIPFTDEIAINKHEPGVSDLVMTGIVAKAIRVPHDDDFGLGAALNAMVSNTEVEAKIFGSHNFFMGMDAETLN